MTEHHHTAHSDRAHAHRPSGGLEGGVKDPVCGMIVDPHTAKHRHTHAGRPYYFCSDGCREKFIVDPSRYLEPEEGPAASVPEGTNYTCPSSTSTVMTAAASK